MDHYVEEAQKVMNELHRNEKVFFGNQAERKITTSQIRGLLAGMSDIYNDVVQLDGNLTDEIMGKIAYLKVQFIYESGRNEKVNKFIQKARLIEEIEGIGSSKQKFIDAERYMEALVAYHRFYGRKDEWV